MEEEIENVDLFDKKAARAFRTITEVSAELSVPPHVLRFWEKKFSEVAPVQRVGGRRYYRPEDIALLKKIEYLLHKEGYTIKGVQKLLKEGTINAVVENRRNDRDQSAPEAPVQVDEEGLPVEPKPELDSVIAELEEISELLKKAV
ncbi:MAG: MerR family transcriptional regulator [Alphaproteobacteria bacterium]|nr:MerR family transcriptional regulator [Alphaproteobacteria bacterium]